MSLATTVTTTETEVIRVYDVALSDQDAEALGVADIATALGSSDLDETYVEIFAIDALDKLGLKGYMVEGLGIPAADIEPYVERITAVSGYVVVVLSKAFKGTTQTLKNGHPLRLIGAFSERKAEPVDVDLTSEAAQRREPAPKKQKSEAAQSGMVATVALIFMFAFVGLILWIA